MYVSSYRSSRFEIGWTMGTHSRSSLKRIYEASGTSSVSFHVLHTPTSSLTCFTFVSASFILISARTGSYSPHCKLVLSKSIWLQTHLCDLIKLISLGFTFLFYTLNGFIKLFLKCLSISKVPSCFDILIIDLLLSGIHFA